MADTPKVAITGAGSGLGAAMAHRFAAEGFGVAVTDVSRERADAVAKELRESGTQAFSQVLDVTRIEDWKALHRRIHGEWGGLDVLINNAGVAAAGRCEESSLEDWQWVIDIDLMGVVKGCHTFIPMLRNQAEQGRRGHIINIASFAALSGMAGISAYGTAKAGVYALSEHLRAEFAASGIGVSVVCPAFVRTQLTNDLRCTDPSYRARVERWMDRSGVTADDVASTVWNAYRRRQFLVLTHRPTRWAWLLKRWWPERYYREVARNAPSARKQVA